MKVIHTSDIGLGKRFSNMKLAGDRLRAGLKTTFSKIVDLTLSEKADILVIAGNLFATLDVSKNLQDFVTTELKKLGSIPAVILPGLNDNYSDGHFWNSWDSLNSQDNIFILAGNQKSHITLEHLDCTIYGISDTVVENLSKGDSREKPLNTKYNIAAACCAPVNVKTIFGKINRSYDYICLGGGNSFNEINSTDYVAAYSGAPERLDFDDCDSGYIACVQINSENKPSITKINTGSFTWHSNTLNAREFSNNNDLLEKIKPLAGPDSLLRLKLTGLALFESSLEPEYVQQLMESEFIFLEIIDDMKVLPENISEVKVSEKTILGQYIKLMAEELNGCEANLKYRLEKSLKVGYSLLQGRESW